MFLFTWNLIVGNPRFLFAHQTTLLIRLVLTLVLSCLVGDVNAESTSGNQEFLVKIVGYENDNESVTQYLLDARSVSPKVVSTLTQAAHPPPSNSYYASLSRERKEREEARRNSVAKFNLRSLPGARWVRSSPDGKYLFLGFEGTWADILRRVLVVDSTSLTLVREF